MIAIQLPCATQDSSATQTEPEELSGYLASMVLVEGSSFMMGDVFGEGREDEMLAHQVTVDDFYLSPYEITVAEYREFVEDSGYVTSAEGPKDVEKQMELIRQLMERPPEEEARRIADEVLSYSGCTWWDNENLRFGGDPDINWRKHFFEQTDSDPVVCLSWNDSIHYCNWLSEKEGLPAAYDLKTGELLDENGNPTRDLILVRGYRLPTEAEWEYAAREGGKRVRFGNGKNIAESNEINFRADAEGVPFSVVGEYRKATTPVGSFAPNALGLYDMSGNSWEWVHDYYGPYSVEQSVNPICSEGYKRVLRSGRWGGDASEIRAARRDEYEAANRCDASGFRIARSK